MSTLDMQLVNAEVRKFQYSLYSGKCYLYYLIPEVFSDIKKYVSDIDFMTMVIIK